MYPLLLDRISVEQVLMCTHITTGCTRSVSNWVLTLLATYAIYNVEYYTYKDDKYLT